MSSKQKEYLQKSNIFRPKHLQIEELTECRIITKNLVYVIGLSSSIANKDKLMRYEYFGQYGNIIKIVVNKNKAYNQSSPHGPSYSAYVTFSKPSEASIAILSLDETMVDNHLIRASFGTTKYCSFFLKGIPCTNNDCLFLHKIADESDIIKRGDLNSNKSIFAQQHSYAIKIADVYNQEIKKKLLSSKKGKTVFPSPDLIYKSIFVIENDPNYHKNYLNLSKQKTKGDENNNSSNEKKDSKANEIKGTPLTLPPKEINLNINSNNSFNNNGNSTNSNKETQPETKIKTETTPGLTQTKTTEHKLFLSRETSRFDFGKNKNSNERIEVPSQIQTLINKKINLYKLTKYMHQEIIDQILKNESLGMDNNNDKTDLEKNEWIQFLNEYSEADADNNPFGGSQNKMNDEYINDFDKINKFIVNKCIIKNNNM